VERPGPRGALPGLLIKVSENKCGVVADRRVSTQGLLAVCGKFRVDSDFPLEARSQEWSTVPYGADVGGSSI